MTTIETITTAQHYFEHFNADPEDCLCRITWEELSAANMASWENAKAALNTPAPFFVLATSEGEFLGTFSTQTADEAILQLFSFEGSLLDLARSIGVTVEQLEEYICAKKIEEAA